MLAFDRVDREQWAGRSVYLIGGGPSLKGFDFERLRNRGVVVAINDAVLHVPWADCVFSIDIIWIARREAALRARTAGEVVVAVPEDWERPKGLAVTALARRRGTGVSPHAWAVMTGDNSGYAALSLALMRGASKVALLGYDMTGRGHWHEGYSWGSRYGHRQYRAWASAFATLAVAAKARGVEVVNCNPASAVRGFRFGEPEEIAEAAA
jgi:hypothetical protein